MNTSNFSLADVLAMLTAAGFGCVCFLGTNFYSLGNVTLSTSLAVIVFLILFGAVFAAKKLKKTSNNFKNRFVLEVVILAFFSMSLISLSLLPFNHFFTVLSKKSIIVNKLQGSIDRAQNMFPAYDMYVENRKDLYNNKLNSVVMAKDGKPKEYNSYNFINGIPHSIQIRKKMQNIDANLFPTNYSDVETKNGMKEIAGNWLSDAKKTTENWKPFGLTNVVVEIDRKSNIWLESLIEISKNKEHGEQSVEFRYDLKFDDVKSYFTTLENPNFISIILSLFVWVLMMLSWFVTKRHTRFPGYKYLFNTTHTSVNEL
jgi:hypothetical protein